MQGKMVQLSSAIVLCLCFFGQSVMAKPGYASGYDVDYYVSAYTINIRSYLFFLVCLFVIIRSYG